MPPPPSTVRAHPLACAGLDTSLGLPFVQERLALLGKTVFLLAFGFFVFANGVLVVSGVSLVRIAGNVGTIMHLTAALLMALLWVVARARPWPVGVLGWLDTAALFLSCSAWGVMARDPNGDALMPAILAVTVTTVTRAILIPSTGARTFWLTSLSLTPLFVINVLDRPGSMPILEAELGHLLHSLFMGLQVFLWLAIAVALSALATRTIYGLRRQVNEASSVGAYTLEERIGSGGMGEVWRARHRMLIRPAAIKLIRRQALGSEPSDPDVLLRRFEREARATAALKSPHTVQLYDFGVADDGTLYYAMELLDGLDLDSLVRRFGPVPPERARHILEQVCASLADAHRNNLVHRDIKPANIVVTRTSASYDFVKVLDFGLVKLEGTQQSEDSVRLTASGVASGTPGFMAPEVALGEAATDHRVDLYALGCVAYWLLTGKLVFEGQNAMKVMIDHAHTPPPPPSSRVEVPIPAALEALVLECLEKDPAKRPASAAALQQRLHDLDLSTAWTAERAERWWSVHAPAPADSRPAADVLLSQEARPLKVIRHVRN